jgi:hypothetical protein
MCVCACVPVRLRVGGGGHWTIHIQTRKVVIRFFQCRLGILLKKLCNHVKMFVVIIWRDIYMGGCMFVQTFCLVLCQTFKLNFLYNTNYKVITLCYAKEQHEHT